MANQGPPAAGYQFNTFAEIRSHSSILFNERLAILFYLLDMRSIQLNTTYNVNQLLEVRGILLQIYKNIRTLIRNNPTVRATLHLDTKDEGIYITDLAFAMIDRMVQFCESTEYSTKKIYILVQELNRVEMIIKDVLQYFHYFIRPDFRQKPDIDMATEQYKEIADKHTIEELKEIVGKKHKIDFESLGSTRIDLTQEIPYEKETDGDISFEEEKV